MRDSDKIGSIFKLIKIKWVVFIITISFFISITLSYISSAALNQVSIVTAFLILLTFILLGISFDMIGVASTSTDEKRFHSMASKKVPGAREAVWLIRNAEKVSSFCNDVVGDISGIISGSTGAIIIAKVVTENNFRGILTGLFITGAIASLTIGGKAIGKSLAINYSSEIIFMVGRFLTFILFWKNNKN